jgi:ATP-binding cassette, subfamily B, multidrug efflux pump
LQDPEIFSGTIFDNITLFDPSITKEYVDFVVNEINMRHLISRYKDGYSHRLEERGKGLSLGERQLISLARAVAHKKSVLLLDEATANIDVGTEKIIQEALHKILNLETMVETGSRLKSHTSIVIAHRLSTIKNVTKILVLHKGVLKEQGTHKSLIEKRGIYEKLYRLQFLG